MSGIARQDDLRSTIPFEDIEMIELIEDEQPTPDLFAALPANPSIVLEETVARFPHQLIQEAPTRAQRGWELTPPLGVAPRRRERKVYDEVTSVRADPREESPWLDLHAVVDSAGRLRLPENVAKRLQEGAIVEVRLASWSVSDNG